MTDKPIALIYTRVSSISQETHGSGNDSQEIRCRDLAKLKEWPVEMVFRDTFTGAGNYMDRPEMKRLIDYLYDNKNKKFVIIFDDIKRLSRDTASYLALMAIFKKLSVQLECLNHKMEDTPESEFITTILAAQGQLERKQNARQVTQKTVAHLSVGDWPYRVPVGYIAVKVEGNKTKVCTIDGDVGKGIQMGLQGFANGRFKSVAELAKYLSLNKYIKNTTRNGMYDSARKILSNIFYAGYIHRPEKGIVMVKGKHEGIISLDEYHTIQGRIEKEIRGEKEYQKYRDEYELRQIARCTDCGNKLRSGKSKGRSKYYHYYICRTKECVLVNKNIAIDDMHKLFHTELRSIESTQEVIDIGVEAFNESFDEVVKSKGLVSSDVDIQMKEIDNQIQILVTNLGMLTNESVVKGIEQKIQELDIKKKILQDKKDKVATLDTKSRTALTKMKTFLKSPYDTWKMCDARQQRGLYKFIFSEDFTYDLKRESRTIVLSPLYAYFKGENGNSLLREERISDGHHVCGR